MNVSKEIKSVIFGCIVYLSFVYKISANFQVYLGWITFEATIFVNLGITMIREHITCTVIVDGIRALCLK